MQPSESIHQRCFIAKAPDEQSRARTAAEGSLTLVHRRDNDETKENPDEYAACVKTIQHSCPMGKKGPDDVDY